MYNAETVAAFISQVEQKASAAAQKILDEAQPELEALIKSELAEGDEVHIGVNRTSVVNNGQVVAAAARGEFVQVIAAAAEYPEIWARFNLPTIKK